MQRIDPTCPDCGNAARISAKVPRFERGYCFERATKEKLRAPIDREFIQLIGEVVPLPIVHVMAPARTHHRSIGFHGPLARHRIP